MSKRSRSGSRASTNRTSMIASSDDDGSSSVASVGSISMISSSSSNIVAHRSTTTSHRTLSSTPQPQPRPSSSSSSGIVVSSSTVPQASNEIVFITSTGPDGRQITSKCKTVLLVGPPGSNSNEQNTINLANPNSGTNKVVSSNPTLNLLLSQPIASANHNHNHNHHHNRVVGGQLSSGSVTTIQQSSGIVSGNDHQNHNHQNHHQNQNHNQNHHHQHNQTTSVIPVNVMNNALQNGHRLNIINTTNLQSITNNNNKRQCTYSIRPVMNMNMNMNSSSNSGTTTIPLNSTTANVIQNAINLGIPSAQFGPRIATPVIQVPKIQLQQPQPALPQSQQQQQKQRVVVLPPQKEPTFLNEIRKMMHAFGDVRTPLEESAKLIETIVRNQMELLLFEAESVALTRGSKGIGIEEFLFLLRNDLNKLARLIRYLRFKDMKPNLSVTVSTLGSDPHKNTTSELGTMFEELGSESGATLSPRLTGGHSRRVGVCYAFLTSIDTPLERFVPLFTDEFHPDPLSQERNRRLADYTSGMNVKDYLYYQACRAVSFAQVGNLNLTHRFAEWILPEKKRLQMRLKLNVGAFETLQHLALETVAVLVELALLVRMDNGRKLKDGTYQITNTFYEQDQLTKLKLHHYARNPSNTTPPELRKKREERERISLMQYYGKESYEQTLEKEEEQKRLKKEEEAKQNRENNCPERKRLVHDVLSATAETMANRTRRVIHNGSSDDKKSLNGTTNGKSNIRIKTEPTDSIVKVVNGGGGMHNGGGTSSTSKAATCWDDAITPADIMEAMRRFEQHPNVWARFTRTNSSLLTERKKRILCL